LTVFNPAPQLFIDSDIRCSYTNIKVKTFRFPEGFEDLVSKIKLKKFWLIFTYLGSSTFFNGFS
jgi:hypothetical protein